MAFRKGYIKEYDRIVIYEVLSGGMYELLRGLLRSGLGTLPVVIAGGFLELSFILVRSRMGELYSLLV